MDVGSALLLKPPPSQVHHPNLPPEIWSSILREATGSDFKLSLSLQPGMELRHRDPEVRESYKEAMRKKLTVMRVCSVWYLLSLRFLYEHIWLESNEQLASLLETLSQPPAGASLDQDPNFTLAPLVRRLDITIPKLRWLLRDNDGQFHKLSPDDGAALSPIVRLCKALPDLASLTFSSAHLPRRTTYDPITSAGIFPRGLRHLSSLASFRLSPTAWLALLDSLPHIEHLDPPDVIVEVDQDISNAQDALARLQAESKEDTTHAAYPALRHLTCSFPWMLGNWYAELPSSVFPNLQNVSINFNGYGPQSSALRAFLAVHGRKLVSIHFKYWAAHPVAEWFAALRDHCPNLTDIVVSASSPAFSGGPIVTALPTVTTLGIQCDANTTDAQSEREGLMVFLFKAKSFANSLPNLRQIRVLGDDNAAALRNPDLADIAQPFFQDCQTRKIQIVDRFSTLLSHSDVRLQGDGLQKAT